LAGAPSGELCRGLARPIFGARAVNTLIFLVIGINIKMASRCSCRLLYPERSWIKWLSVLFILPWAVPSIPTILSVRFMFNPEWGVVNTLIFKLTGEDGRTGSMIPPCADHGDRRAHLEIAAFWTLILMTRASRLPFSICRAPKSTAPLGQKFRFITWP